MDFITKNGLYIRLQKDPVFEADEALLKEKDPGAIPLKTRYFDKVRRSKEILWALLEIAGEKEILENRNKFLKEKKPEGGTTGSKTPEEELMALKKGDLLKLAGDLGVTEQNTKKEIVAAILEDRKKVQGNDFGTGDEEPKVPPKDEPLEQTEGLEDSKENTGEKTVNVCPDAKKKDPENSPKES
jgi:hypothetical protein